MSRKAEDIFFLTAEAEIEKTKQEANNLSSTQQNLLLDSDLGTKDGRPFLQSTVTASWDSPKSEPAPLDNPSLQMEELETAPAQPFENSAFPNPVGNNIASLEQEKPSKRLELLGVESHLASLCQLIANVTESYTAAIFLADNEKEVLFTGGAQTLSSDFVEAAEIAYGAGLVGWVAEAKTKLTICPFNHDSSSLLYYRDAQPLKSFCALPILSQTEELLGVLVCDSTKSYDFSKKTEKLLMGFCNQAATLLKLHQKIEDTPSTIKVNPSLLETLLQDLGSCQNENELMTRASKLSPNLISRDALAIVTTAEQGIGSAKYYSVEDQQKEHRLLDLVAKHKKILFKDRSVHAMPADDMKQRSFLSIPFSSLGKEAGAFILLSRPHEAFDASEIAAVEKIASTLSKRLEHLRLLNQHKSSPGRSSLPGWRQFKLLASNRIKNEPAGHSLIKIGFNCFPELELSLGIENCEEIKSKIDRLVEQLKLENSLSCRLYDNSILVLTPSGQVDSFIHRICNQLQRLELSSSQTMEQGKIGESLISGARFVVTKSPKDGETLTELIRKALQLGLQQEKASV